jgi:hypothetical protein
MPDTILTPYSLILVLMVFNGIFSWFLSQAGYIKYTIVDPIIFTGVILIVLTAAIGFTGEVTLFGIKITARQVVISGLLTWLIMTFVNIQIPSGSPVASIWYVVYGIMIVPALIVMALYFIELAK